MSRPLEPPTEAWERDVSRWLAVNESVADADVRGWLRRFVPEYAPGVGLAVTDWTRLAPPPGLEERVALDDGSAGALQLVGGANPPMRRAGSAGREA